jgi:ATP-dependent DNA helicase RecQ
MIPSMLSVDTADARLQSTLQSTFGYSTFRPLQQDIVRTLLDRRDAFVLMPTGGGKSLCYQLPALLLDGTAVVVSPLIALMKDQVDALQALGVAATFINSSLDSSEVGRRQAALLRGDFKLVYVAPERLMQPGFLHLLSRARVSFFAIDEAHCISEWGHDFRPEYRELRRLREAFPGVPHAAFTATATRRVQADIVDQLGLEQAASFRGSFNRANLVYEVRPKNDAYGQLVEYLREQAGASGIVYCGTRAGTEKLAEKLQADGFHATAYHAGLDNEQRRARQEAFIRDDVGIIVATIAFGMGIDKPDVRFVVHYDLPRNLEGYYQESGRAGRDGDPSDCILFYSYGDAKKHERFILEKSSERERAVAMHQLRQMIQWAQGDTCRRRALLAYFDEALETEQEPCCDVCRGPAEQMDYTVPAQMLLSCARRTGERFGVGYLVQVLRGSREERVLRFKHDRLPTYGIGKDISRQEWTHLARELVRRGYLRQSPEEFDAAKITEQGEAVLFRGEQVVLPAPRHLPKSTPGGGAGAPRADVFERLRALRKRLADERGVPPYVIFHDSTLRQMAVELPTSVRDLRRVQGVGERKLADFGNAFVQEIVQYVLETGEQPAVAAPERQPALPVARRRERGDSARATLELHRQGMDVAQIVAERQLSTVTVLSHLAELMEAGESVDLEAALPSERRLAIEAAIRAVGLGPLRPVMDRLGDGFSYEEIRLVRAALGWRRSDQRTG